MIIVPAGAWRRSFANAQKDKLMNEPNRKGSSYGNEIALLLIRMPYSLTRELISLLN